MNVSSYTSPWYTEKEMTSGHAMQSMHVYKMRSRKDNRSVDLIFPMRCLSVGCGTVNQMQSATPSSTTGQMML